MKIIGKKEKHGLVLKRGSSRVNRELYTLLLSMRVGDSAIIDTKDWKGKDTFTHVIHNSGTLKKKFTVAILEDGSGWLVERINR